jgi:hypothetical protein
MPFRHVSTKPVLGTRPIIAMPDARFFFDFFGGGRGSSNNPSRAEALARRSIEGGTLPLVFSLEEMAAPAVNTAAMTRLGDD